MNTHNKQMSLQISSTNIARNTILIFLIIELLLVALDLAFNLFDFSTIHAIQQLFNLAREGSLGSWFSSTQTLLTGLVLWLLFIRFNHDPDTRIIKKYSWALIALFFTFMAIDDAAAIHETIGSVYESLVTNADEATDIIGGTILESYPSYPWQVVLGPVFFLMGLFILVFLWIEISSTKMRLLLLAALSSYTIAVGLDYVEGLYDGYKTIIVATSISYDVITHLSRVIEEFLEMLGTTFFLALFLQYLAMHTETIQLGFDE